MKKIDEIFTVDLTLCSKCQIYGEDFVNIRGLLRKYELKPKTRENPGAIKFIYSDKAIKFCKNSTLLLSYAVLWPSQNI